MVSACGGAPAPTMHVDLVAAPGASIFDSIERIEILQFGPVTVADVKRSAAGLPLSFDVETTAGFSLNVQGFDASGTVVAVGESPPDAMVDGDVVTLDGDATHVSIYVAAPNSIAEAPQLGAPWHRNERATVWRRVRRRRICDR